MKLGLTLLIGAGIWISVFFFWSVWAWSHDTGSSSHAFIYNRTWVNLALGLLPGISAVGGAIVAFGTGTIKLRVLTAAVFLAPSLLIATWLVFGTARWGVCGIPGSPCGWPN
jgi:hypothetical protein